MLRNFMFLSFYFELRYQIFYFNEPLLVDSAELYVQTGQVSLFYV